jgi:hypothetical protein
VVEPDPTPKIDTLSTDARTFRNGGDRQATLDASVTKIAAEAWFTEAWFTGQ